MEDDKICEVGNSFKFHFRHLSANSFKPKPSVVQKQKQVLLYYKYHKYIQYSLNFSFYNLFIYSNTIEYH